MKKKGNYVVIEKWMTKDLGLRGNELLVYAIIYGFSQDGESRYYGSRRYISEFLNMSLSTVDRTLASLVSKNLIIKETEMKYGITVNNYKIEFNQNEEGCSHFD